MEEKNKSNMPLIIIIVVMLMVIVGLGGYIFYDKVVLKNDKNETNENKIIDKVEEDDVEENLSESEKTELSTKISQILFKGILRSNGVDAYVPSDDENFVDPGLDRKILTDVSVTPETRALVALNSVLGTKITIDRTEKSEEEVKSTYKSYFGTDWQDIDLNNLGVSCPHFSYDAGKKVFYADAACGGSTATRVVLHKGDYEIEDGIATVDLYIANLVTDMNGKSIVTSEIYPYYERLDSNKIITEAKDIDNYIMSEDDRKKANKYEVSFKKTADGSFYFNSIIKK